MDFTPEFEYEVIREEFSHKLYRNLVNSSNKVWRESAQTKNPTSPFQIGDYIGYTTEGQNDILELVDINTNGTDITKYSIDFLRGNKMILINEFINQ